MKEQNKNLTKSAGRAMEDYQQMFNEGGTGPIGQTLLGKQMGALEAVAALAGLTPKKKVSQTTSRSITGKDGTRRTISTTSSDGRTTQRISESGFNPDGTKWEKTQSQTISEEDSKGRGEAKGRASKVGKALQGGANKILNAAEDLTR